MPAKCPFWLQCARRPCRVPLSITMRPSTLPCAPPHYHAPFNPAVRALSTAEPSYRRAISRTAEPSSFTAACNHAAAISLLSSPHTVYNHLSLPCPLHPSKPPLCRVRSPSLFLPTSFSHTAIPFAHTAAHDLFTVSHLPRVRRAQPTSAMTTLLPSLSNSLQRTTILSLSSSPQSPPSFHLLPFSSVYCFRRQPSPPPLLLSLTQPLCHLLPFLSTCCFR
ncbi:hypothetical protein AMTR_s00096p00134570 [Amborella trichopoda]|uniref:Uncharacterized protein n=1 Tax=Amborella trichopoda TaxID=13333 RepID=W1NXS3_AMBTC|nr:hypothetical protein AMTR_s00096p00134570 [Amborella trichopoda]